MTTVGSSAWLLSTGLSSEIEEAYWAEVAGDPWPLAILDFKAGNDQALVGLIQRQGVPPESQAAAFVADVVAGRFRRNRSHGLLRKKQKLLMWVSLYRTLLEAWRANPGAHGGEAGCLEKIGNRRFSSVQQIYEIVAADLSITVEDIEQTVKRNRRRVFARGQ